jgi:hypothetical protein
MKRFRLRTLILSIVIVALICALVVQERRAALREERHMARIEQLSGVLQAQLQTQMQVSEANRRELETLKAIELFNKFEPQRTRSPQSPGAAHEPALTNEESERAAPEG